MNKTHPAFTLFEMLLTFIIFALVINILNQSLDLINQQIMLFQEDKATEWTSFKVLLGAELSHYDLLEVSPTKITLSKKENPYDIYHIGLAHNKIYKKPGHHPYLYQVESWSLNYVAPILYIQVTFLNGQSFICHHICQTKGRHDAIMYDLHGD